MNKNLHDAATAIRRLSSKGFDRQLAVEMAVQDYGVTREQLAPLLVDAKDLSAEDYEQAKRQLLNAVK